MKKFKTKLFAQLSTQSEKRKKTYCQKLFNRFKQQNVYLTMFNNFYFNVYLKNLSQHTVEILRKIKHN